MLCTVCSPVRSGRGTCLRMNPAKRAVLLKIKCFKILIIHAIISVITLKITLSISK